MGFFSKASHPRAAQSQNHGFQIWWGLSKGVGSPCSSERLSLRGGFAGIAAAGAAWCGHTAQPQGVLQHPWDLGALKPSPALSSCSLRGSIKSVISKECRQGLCCYLWREFLLLESFKLFFLPKKKRKNQREKKKSSLPSGHNLVQYVTFQTVRKFL